MLGVTGAAELINLEGCFQTEMLYSEFLKELHVVANQRPWKKNRDIKPSDILLFTGF